MSHQHAARKHILIKEICLFMETGAKLATCVTPVFNVEVPCNDIAD
jgi:hypothetical protein